MTDTTPCPLAEAARRHSAAIALASGTDQLTYAELDRSVQRLSNELRDQGFTPGQRIAVMAAPSFASIAWFWALMRMGATVCWMSTKWPKLTLQQAMETHRCQSLVSAAKAEATFRDARTSTDRGAPDSRVILASPATLILSSGSLGPAKAIAHDLSAHRSSALAANSNLPLRVNDRWLLSLPLHHVSGIGILFRCTIAGATIAFPDANDALSDQIIKLQATHLSLVTIQLIRLLDQTNECPNFVRSILLGGGPIPTSLIKRAYRLKWPLATTYGLTEMASQVTTTAPGATPSELRTAGRVLPGREVRVDDTQEILVRGDSLFLGYLQAGALSLPLDKDGWFHTGDFGYWDHAERLVVIGRLDNLFISGGENIYPEEIERALLDVSGIQQAIVVPVQHAEYGNRPIAFVESDAWNVERWRSTLADRLPAFKIPDRFVPWPEQTGLKPKRADFQRIANMLSRKS